MQSTDPIERLLYRAKKKRLPGLKRLGIRTVRDLLYHFPVRYTAATRTDGTLENGKHIAVTGTIERMTKRYARGKRRIMLAEAVVRAKGKRVEVVWFHQPYIADKFPEGSVAHLSGTVSGSKRPRLTNPVIIREEKGAGQEEEGDGREELTAIYPETRDISSRYLADRIEKALSEEGIKKIRDPIPEKTRKQLRLPNLYNALIYIHKPRTKDEHEGARKRFMFEQTFILQIRQQRARKTWERKTARRIETDGKKTGAFMRERFGFRPTGDQKKAIKEITEDLRKDRPMTRLLEGDVGSGKTAVAAAAIYSAVTAKPEEETSGRPQVAYLAPTELLARQQFHALVNLFDRLPIQIGLISGKACRKYPAKAGREKTTAMAKAAVKKRVASGEIAVVVGTHALIQKDVAFRRLALTIIDEQHRFGVAQRRALTGAKDGRTPHLLSMTATPIPRTLALTVYGDLDASVMREMPKGRKSPRTTLLRTGEIEKARARVREEVKKGRQAYILCPRVQEDGESGLRSVEEEYRHLSEEVFPEIPVGMLHGKMSQKEKEDSMRKFSEKKVRILVCTTVVEVGIDVPNATVIVILHAERFGLAQLHQIRGRVIRGKHQAYCCAVTDSANEATMERLETFRATSDGFTLAEKDLEFRGSGEIAGLRQSGVPDLLMEGLKNRKLLEAARDGAKKIMEKDPDLKRYPAVRDRVEIETRDE